MAYTTIDNAELFFQAKLYSGNGSTNAITLDGSEDLQPDWLWVKCRSDANGSQVFDALRTTYSLSPNATDAAANRASDGFTSLNSDGFTMNGSGSGGNTNVSGRTYVAFNWKAGGSSSTNSDGDINGTQTVNQTAGFSVTTYTGNGGSNQSLGHRLGVTPQIYICKRRDNTGQWLVMNTVIDGTLDYLFLETQGSKSNSSQSLPTSSLVYLQNGGDANESGGTHVCYAFCEKKGYSKFGMYTGNSSTDGTYVHLGFAPAWVMCKPTDASDNWVVLNNKAHNAINSSTAPYFFYANKSFAETTDTKQLDFLSNGFKIRSSGNTINRSGPMLFMAFAESPFVNSNGVPNNGR